MELTEQQSKTVKACLLQIIRIFQDIRGPMELDLVKVNSRGWAVEGTWTASLDKKTERFSAEITAEGELVSFKHLGSSGVNEK